MSRGSPSLVALLGLLAVAGYQNRDKLSGLMQNAGGNADYDSNRDNAGMRMESADVSSASTGGGMMGDLRGMLTGAGGGGFLTGLTELIGRFTNPVQAAKACSWVDTGPNGSLSSAPSCRGRLITTRRTVACQPRTKPAAWFWAKHKRFFHPRIKQGGLRPPFSMS